MPDILFGQAHDDAVTLSAHGEEVAFDVRQRYTEPLLGVKIGEIDLQRLVVPVYDESLNSTKARAILAEHRGFSVFVH